MKAFALAAALMVGLAAAAPAVAVGQDAKSSPISTDKLPISLERIGRRLAERSATSPANSPLFLVFHVDVYGTAPKIDIFKDFDLKNGPVPFGAPTHQDFIDQMTPQEFRSQPADLTGIFRWLTQQIRKK